MNINITKIPRIIKKLGFDFSWDEKKVWLLKYPTEKMDMKELEWHFDIPFWKWENIKYTLKPIDVIKNKIKYSEEYNRTIKSNLIYPIDIMENKGKYTILDGLHRLLKHKLLGHYKVPVRIIPRKEISNIKE